MMPVVNIRAASPADLPDLMRLWHEKTVIQQQFDRRFTLVPNGEMEWAEAALLWLNNPQCRIAVAERDQALCGYAIGWRQPAPPGLMPPYIGLITDMTMDAHQQANGSGQLLITYLREWFTEQGVENMMVSVPRRGAVEQAFWRAQGAVAWMDLLWLK